MNVMKPDLLIAIIKNKINHKNIKNNLAKYLGNVLGQKKMLKVFIQRNSEIQVMGWIKVIGTLLIS